MKEPKEITLSKFPTFLANRNKYNYPENKNKSSHVEKHNYVFGNSFRTLGISSIPQSVSIHVRDNSLAKSYEDIEEFRQSIIKKNIMPKDNREDALLEMPILIFPTHGKNPSESTQGKQRIECKLAESHLQQRKTIKDKNDKRSIHPQKSAYHDINVDNQMIKDSIRHTTKRDDQSFQTHKQHPVQKQISKFNKSNVNLASTETFGKEKIKKNYWKQQLRNCLADMSIIRENHLQTISQCTKVQKIYIEQIDMLDRFYSSLMEIINHYKNQHLKGLRMQCAYIKKQFNKQISYLSKAITDIDDLSNEIRTNMDEILSSKNQAIFKSCMSYYYQTASILTKKQKNICEETKRLPNYSLTQLQETIQFLDRKVHNIIFGQASRIKSLYTCIKPINLKIKEPNQKVKINDLKHRRSCTNVFQKQNNSLKNNQKARLQIRKHQNSYGQGENHNRTKSETQIFDNNNFGQKFGFFLNQTNKRDY